MYCPGLSLQPKPDSLGPLLGTHLLKGFERIFPVEGVPFAAGSVVLQDRQRGLDLPGNPESLEGVFQLFLHFGGHAGAHLLLLVFHRIDGLRSEPIVRALQRALEKNFL